MAENDMAQSCADEKHCNTCGETKPTTAFSRQKTSADGYRRLCKPCRNAENRRYYGADLEKNRRAGREAQRARYWKDPVAAAAKMRAWKRGKRKPKVIASPEEIAARDELRLQRKREARKRTYEKNKEKVLATAAKYRAAHKAQERANRAAHYERNKAHVAVVAKEWRSANKVKINAMAAARRARMRGAGGRFTDADIAFLFEKQGAKCAHSWCRASLKTVYQIDHIVPIARGGANGKNNVQLLCPTCNRKKQAKDPIDWAQQNGLLL